MTSSPLKVEDSRAQFEAWHNSTHRWKVTPTMRTDDGYTNNIQASNGWAAWQASRAAIVVEPPKAEFFLVWDGKKHSTTFREATESYSAILRAAGITVKGDWRETLLT